MSQNTLSTVRTGSRARYRVVYSPLAAAFKIADEHMRGMYCALPDASGHLKELTFRNAKAAREWLRLCGKGGE